MAVSSVFTSGIQGEGEGRGLRGKNVRGKGL